MLPITYFIYAGEKLFSISLYVLFLILDALDGYAARKFKCETVFGKNFDFMTDGVGGAAVVLVLLLKGMMSWLYILLLAIPLMVKSIYVIKGIRMVKKTFIASKWGKINGAVLFLIPLMFLIGHAITIVIAYLLLVYVYVSSVKYVIEINRMSRKG